MIKEHNNSYLNTSHVKVKPPINKTIIKNFVYLNTSHVKVNLYNA